MNIIISLKVGKIELAKTASLSLKRVVKPVFKYLLEEKIWRFGNVCHISRKP